MPLHLTDREQIEQLLARYAELVDAGDFEGVAGLLRDAAIVTEEGTIVAAGREQIHRLYETTTRRFEEGTTRTLHVITNVQVEPVAGDAGEGADRVESRSCFTVLQATDGVPLQPIVAGRYRDVFARGRDGRWRFVERCMMPALLGDASQHLLFDPTDL
ncbi:MAG: nuclear transport factor 2 family protein [Actinobacteria bacterium]|nr:nuclear transport factor 2 family protein [Actinomycetota bacterium]